MKQRSSVFPGIDPYGIEDELQALRDERREHFEADEKKLLDYLVYQTETKYGDKTVVIEFLKRCAEAAGNGETLDDVAYDMAQERTDELFSFIHD